jgi:hypothetical protein
MSMSASTVRTSFANVMSNSTCNHMHSHALKEAFTEEAIRGDQQQSAASSRNHQQSAAISPTSLCTMIHSAVGKSPESSPR